jgi:hypothetical protein
MQLLAPDGFNVLPAGGRPAAGRRPTDQWRIGEDVIDAHSQVFPADLLAGDYQLEVGYLCCRAGGGSAPWAARAGGRGRSDFRR